MLAVIGAVGQAKQEAMLGASEGAHRQGKGAGRYKGRVPTVRRQAAEKLRLKQSLSVDITALRDQIEQTSSHSLAMEEDVEKRSSTDRSRQIAIIRPGWSVA
jgi:hypothetical protein